MLTMLLILQLEFITIDHLGNRYYHGQLPTLAIEQNYHKVKDLSNGYKNKIEDYIKRA